MIGLSDPNYGSTAAKKLVRTGNYTVHGPQVLADTEWMTNFTENASVKDQIFADTSFRLRYGMKSEWVKPVVDNTHAVVYPSIFFHPPKSSVNCLVQHHRTLHPSALLVYSTLQRHHLPRLCPPGYELHTSRYDRIPQRHPG
jgi:hypothetical protein